jgi:glycosyltransferase involved in cell wall biosynthesis
MLSSIKVVIPVRNAQQWIAKCIDSVATQHYDGDWSCMIIDDASTDGTQTEIERFLELLHPSVRSKFKTAMNSTRQGALANFLTGFRELGADQDPESVLVQLDGDDWLYGPVVFQIIRNAYERSGCWMTWGNYAEWPTGAPGMARAIPGEWHADSSYRSKPWVMSHLRTFKSHLWSSIKDEDLRDCDGNYFDVTWDLAHMFPMVEMAGERSCFIPYVLYCYNRNNPLSDDRIYRERQLRFESEIRSKQSYARKQE